MGGSLHKWRLVHKGEGIEEVYMEVVGEADYGSNNVRVMVVHKVGCEMGMEVDPIEVIGDVVRLEGVVVEKNFEVQASPFSLLEHATLFARDLWFNKSPIQSWLNVFSAHFHIDQAAKFVPGPIMLIVMSFTRSKPGLRAVRKIGRNLSENVQETPEETGEVVQDSMEEEDFVKDDTSEEIVFTVNNVAMLTFDLNKTPEENGVF
ncbi:hypothetical protein Ahy_A09g043462 [Arachis hypogaea]|uniref:Uncharacterized protein n=1 Tax=Arachis hypogaea TaxID=3818 RepID=A0A445BIB2_ARAHY|nr:hypothetical protein Ahy_A09g043462 [Arachis hypogaea]